MTPYEKLKSLPDAEQYLNEEISFNDLENKVISITDLESAKLVHIQRNILFSKIFFKKIKLTVKYE